MDNAKIRVTMTMESMDGECSSKVSTILDEDEEYIPEIVAELAQRLMKGYSVPDDVANDIQSVGWERFARQIPYQNGEYLISVKDGKYTKTTIDIWDMEKHWANHKDEDVAFWAQLPSSPAFWSLGG